MSVALRLDTSELEALIRRTVDERVAAAIAELHPPSIDRERLPGTHEFKAHADYAFRHSFPEGGSLGDMATRIVANGWRNGGDAKYSPFEQAKANLSALPNMYPDGPYYRPQRGYIAKRDA